MSDVERVLLDHRHGGRVNSREGWVECLCGERLPCEFDGPPHHDPRWDDDEALSSDYAAIISHQSARLAPLLAEVRAEALAEGERRGGVKALRGFAQWVATNRAYNGSDYPHAQSLYNECLNAVLPGWAAEFAALASGGAVGEDRQRDGS